MLALARLKAAWFVTSSSILQGDGTSRKLCRNVSVVLQFRHEVAAARGGEVEDVPERRQQIKSAVLIGSHDCGSGVKVFQGATRESKNAHAWILATLLI